MTCKHSVKHMLKLPKILLQCDLVITHLSWLRDPRLCDKCMQQEAGPGNSRCQAAVDGPNCVTNCQSLLTHLAECLLQIPLPVRQQC